MKQAIDILMVEDDVYDAELIQFQLLNSGLEFTCRRVFTREQFLKELTTAEPDIIFSDHGLPCFSGYEARTLARRHSPDTPFIFVTGGIGEMTDRSAEMTDAAYVLKSELPKLPEVVRRLLVSQKPTNPSAAAPSPRSKSPPASSPNRAVEHGILLVDNSGVIVSWNAGATQLFGYEPEHIVGSSFSSLFPRQAIERNISEQLMRASSRDDGFKGELLLERQDASHFWATVSIHPVRGRFDGAPTAFSIVVHNLDEQTPSPMPRLPGHRLLSRIRP